MTVKIYRDDAANAIFVEDNNGAQFLNNLQAVTDSPSDTVFRIRDKSRDHLLLALTCNRWSTRLTLCFP